MRHEIVDTEDHFVDGEVLIGGPALMEFEVARFNDADIGGADGWETTVALVYIDLNGVPISRDQLVRAFGQERVIAFEDRVAEMDAQGMEA